MATANSKYDARSVANLKVYQLAHSLEEQVWQLTKTLPESETYKLANDLRRASAGVAHYIAESHRRYSYALKIDTLHAARTEAEEMQKLLLSYEEAKYGQAGQLLEDYTTVVKQCWGLIKWLKARQDEKQATAQIEAKDELVAARA